MRDAERPVDGFGVLAPFDRSLVIAQGKALALVAAYLARAGIVDVQEFGRTLGVLAVAGAEDEPDAPDSATEADILGAWAGIIIDSGER